jgi:hypothetical protein
LEREATLVLEKPKPHVTNPELIGTVIKDNDGNVTAAYNAETGKWDTYD